MGLSTTPPPPGSGLDLINHQQAADELHTLALDIAGMKNLPNGVLATANRLLRMDPTHRPRTIALMRQIHQRALDAGCVVSDDALPPRFPRLAEGT